MQTALSDEDWLGGNSEPETKFIQDMTEMNDDNGDGASEFKSTHNPPFIFRTHPISVGTLYRLPDS